MLLLLNSQNIIAQHCQASPTCLETHVMATRNVTIGWFLVPGRTTHTPARSWQPAPARTARTPDNVTALSTEEVATF